MAAPSGYTTLPFPVMRRLALDMSTLAKNRYIMRGLLEIDVTRPRQLIRAHEAATGERLSFTAFLAACIGQAVDRYKEVHAWMNWRGQLVIFDEVDIGTMVEIEDEQQKLPIAHIVHAANHKTVQQIHAEIRAIQHNPAGESNLRLLKLVVWLPGFIRRALLRVLNRSPHLMHRIRGTVSLTAVGMFAKGSGWGLTPSVHALTVIVGGIARKPGVIEDRIEIREYLNLTVDFDHEMVDGAPAARFTRCLIDLIENGYGLPTTGAPAP